MLPKKLLWSPDPECVVGAEVSSSRRGASMIYRSSPELDPLGSLDDESEAVRLLLPCRLNPAAAAVGGVGAGEPECRRSNAIIAGCEEEEEEVPPFRRRAACNVPEWCRCPNATPGCCEGEEEEDDDDDGISA